MTLDSAQLASIPWPDHVGNLHTIVRLGKECVGKILLAFNNRQLFDI